MFPWLGHFLRESVSFSMPLARFARGLVDLSDLLFFLTWRDIKVRYKQTVLGVAWALLRPFIDMMVFSLVFGNWLKVASG